VTVTSPRPRCPSGVVAVELQAWTAEGRRRRSAWADEPLRCSRGCALTPSQVERVLVAVYEAPARQLPLFQEAAG
jgi:hypothetical protein